MLFPQNPSLDLCAFWMFGFCFAKNRCAQFFSVLHPRDAHISHSTAFLLTCRQNLSSIWMSVKRVYICSAILLLDILLDQVLQNCQDRKHIAKNNGPSVESCKLKKDSVTRDFYEFSKNLTKTLNPVQDQ